MAIKDYVSTVLKLFANKNDTIFLSKTIKRYITIIFLMGIEFLCKNLCICIILKNDKNGINFFNEFSEILNNAKKEGEIKEINKKKRGKYETIYFRILRNNVMGFLNKEGNEITFSIRFNGSNKYKITLNKIKKFEFDFFNKMMELLSKNKISSSGHVCVNCSIDGKKYCNTLTDLPISLTKKSDIDDELGEISIYQLGFKFEKSKIGIDKFIVSDIDDVLSIFLKYSFKTKVYLNIMLDNYKYVNKIINLFIERR